MKLLVIIPDALSALVKKGEITSRYYNPGNLFDEVHIMMTNNDQVNPQEVQITVGDARLFLHNIPIEESGYLQRSPFFMPWLLKKWASPMLSIARKIMLRRLIQLAEPAVRLAGQIEPNLIRCHANDYNAVIARCIKEKYGTPYLVSLHTNPDVNMRRRKLKEPLTWHERLYNLFFDDIETYGLQKADLVLPVYKSILPYLKRVGCQHVQVAYNVLSEHLQQKKDYTLHQPIRVISVGRHYEEKNPTNLILAVKQLPQVHLTLVGNGPYQPRLEALVQENDISERVTFLPALMNIEVCHRLPEFDIFAIHIKYSGLSKSLLEALLTGLPCIINYSDGEQTPELLEESLVHFVENTKDGYFQGLQKLIEDHAYREQLGRKAYAYAQERWSPKMTEAVYVNLYKKFMLQ